MNNQKISRYNPGPVVRSAKRAIDKQIININHVVTNAAVSTTLYTATYPCTITGIRWSLCYGQALDDNLSAGTWFIVIVRDGYSSNTPSLTSGSSLYQPETDVLSFGSFCAFKDTSGSGASVLYDGNTKTMRKIQAGDQMFLVSLGTDVNQGTLFGAIQFFLKS